MIVCKFGGTSVQDAEAMTRVAEIIGARRKRQPVVVASAMGKTTNHLLEATQTAAKGKRQEALDLLSKIKDNHLKEAQKMGIAVTEDWVFETIQSYFKEMRDIAKGLAALGELTPRITDAMASALRKPVRLGQVVKAIDATGNAVEVRTADGLRYTARAVICAVPFSTLREIDVRPALAGEQARAVDTLPYQKMHQTALQVSRPFWESDGLEPSMWTDAHIGRVAAIYHGAGVDDVSSLVVSSFGAGATYLDRLGKEGAARHVVAQIEKMRPAAKGALTVVGQHSWSRDPFAGGAWAYFHPGTVTRFLPAMNEPHGRVHFCGEHTSLVAHGMEGAVESGWRAAAAVVAQLG